MRYETWPFLSSKQQEHMDFSVAIHQHAAQSVSWEDKRPGDDESVTGLFQFLVTH